MIKVKVIHVASDLVDVGDGLRAVTDRINEELQQILGEVQRVEVLQYERYPDPDSYRRDRAYAMVAITYTT